MDLKASLYLLVLLLGLSKALPFTSGVDIEALLEEPDNVDITTQILTTNNASGEFLMEGDVAIQRGRNALSCFYCKWRKSANGLVEIPVTISYDFSYYDKVKIERAMLTFEKETCIRFVPRASQVDYISIENRRGCYSFIGRSGGGQVLSLDRYGCVHHGIIQHELVHALGFFHEHTRPDRDQYVKINWKYVDPQTTHNFDKQYSDTLSTQYDYSSLMHYSRTAFTTVAGQETIIPIPNPNVAIGQRVGLSPTDILRINKLYRCCT